MSKYNAKKRTPEQIAQDQARHQEAMKARKQYKIGAAVLMIDSYNTSFTEVSLSYKRGGVMTSVYKKNLSPVEYRKELYDTIARMKKDVRK